MNLPWAERFRKASIMVVQILPGLSEPSSLNPFLVPLDASPLVDASPA